MLGGKDLDLAEATPVEVLRSSSSRRSRSPSRSRSSSRGSSSSSSKNRSTSSHRIISGTSTVFVVVAVLIL